MRVLMDFHHHDLWESMELLCARLGWELYRPMGMEWFNEGYWNFERQWHGDAVAKQYLEPWGSDVDGLRYDTSHQRYIKLWTLEEARAYKPDIVIASVAHNHEGLARFASEVGATFGLQLGNVRFAPIEMNEDRWDLAAFGLVTSIMPGPITKPSVVYHQEFDLDDFHYEPPNRNEQFTVASFVNCFPENPDGYAQFRATAAVAPEMEWQVYGSYGQVPTDEFSCGNLDRCSDVGDRMRASDIAWHTKQWSDGFGHVIHNWFAVGRPVLGYQSYYQSQLAGPLWDEGVTSFDLTDRSPDYAASIIRMLRDDPDRHRAMSEAAAKRFREVVNFDAEEQAIRAMFAQVLP